jgi:hypothetical protein
MHRLSSHLVSSLLIIISFVYRHQRNLLAHVDDAANAVAGLHVAKGLVDLVEGLAVRDELVDLEVTLHVVGDEAGQLRAALDAAEGAAFPYAARDELEGWEELAWCGEDLGKARGEEGEGMEMDRRGEGLDVRRVAISWPAAATPMMMDSPQPLWQASRAARMTLTLPVQSKV